MKNYYSILQVAPTATQQEIKKAYRLLVKTHHPDVASADAAGFSMQDINEAYAVLSNPGKRQAYDWKRNQPEEEQTGPQQAYGSGFNARPKRRLSERELIAPYLRYVYPFFRVSLAFCLLLLLDYVLPLRKKNDETKYVIEVYAPAQRVEAGVGSARLLDHTEVHTFSGQVIDLPPDAAAVFASQPQLLLYQTPIFRKSRFIAPAGNKSFKFRIGGTIYGNLIFIPLLLLLLSGIGLYKGITDEMRFSIAVVSSLMLLISIALLLM
jgi:hypothetical protein